MLRKIQSMLTWLYQRKLAAYLDKLKSRGLCIGEGTQILEPFFLDPDHCFLISIGANCTLAPNVRMVAHDASTKQYLGYTRIGRITIHDNCFIGDSVIVLPNVTIGPGSIIGAGSVVNKSIPEGSVAAGNPAKVICSLDNYLARVGARAEKKGVYDERHLIENITDQDIRKVLDALEHEEGYIV